MLSQLAVAPLAEQQPGTMGEKPRSAAFVGFDVRPGMADDGLVRLAQMRQGHAVRRRAVEGEEHLGIVPEQNPNPVGRTGRPLVMTVSRGAAGVGPEQIFQCLGTRTRPIVTGKLGQLIHERSVVGGG